MSDQEHKHTHTNPDGTIEFNDPEALRSKLGEEKFGVMEMLRRKTNLALLRPMPESEPEPEK